MLNWLHLSDLHCGMSIQRPLWPNVSEAFYDSVRKLSEKCGPWDLVLFTGDLVQQGRKDEYDELEQKIFKPLWKLFEELHQQPILLAVPGNHDLVRPDAKKPSAAVRQLLRPGGLTEIADEFFTDKNSEYRAVIDTAFLNYRDWWQYRIGVTRPAIQQGLLPGDFSTTIEADGKQIGIVGLNTAFLQLADGDYRGRLVWDIRQLHEACGGNPAEWIKSHDVSLLLTHQGPLWLSEESRNYQQNEINPAGRFALHLFGHEHESNLESRAVGGGPPRTIWQSPSIFGPEKYEGKLDRRHGYAADRKSTRLNSSHVETSYAV